MRWRRFGEWCGFHLFGISLAIFLVINLTFLYRWAIDWYGISQAVGLTRKQIMVNYHELLQYLNLPWVTTLHMTNFSSSSAGLQHFADVKKLFLLNEGVLVIAGVVTFFFVRNLIRTKTLWQVIRPLQIAVVIPLFVGAMMSISFDQFFVAFHEVLFRNDDWMFDPQKDPVINILPETFFLQCFVVFFLLLECYYVFFIVIGRKQLRSNK
ncbi:TIGR01906 family membrane protein [Pediococcus siamensis]|uniref:TIGR01906 family membrane protein n=1 Tax=Pediococcus siamensis TaxID=381829 RepID=UPI0039A222A7